jgi:FeS assembly protein IscX
VTLRFTDLREGVLKVLGFEDDPLASNEGRLEAFQVAGYDEREV